MEKSRKINTTEKEYNVNFDDCNTCEIITCDKTANSKVKISLKSGTIVFFNVCNLCKEIFDKELDYGEIMK